MEAKIGFKRKDNTICYIQISQLNNNLMRELKSLLIHLEYIRLKEIIILNQFKYSIKKETDYSDPIGDLQLFKKEMTRYFKVAKTKVIEDTNVSGEFSLYVNTDMFGGTQKHISKKEYYAFA